MVKQRIWLWLSLLVGPQAYAQHPVTPWHLDSLYNQLYEWYPGVLYLEDGDVLQEDFNYNFIAEAVNSRRFYMTGEGRYFANKVEQFNLEDTVTGQTYHFVSATGEISKRDVGPAFYNVLYEGQHYVLLSKYVIRWELWAHTRFILHGVRWTVYLLGPKGLLRYGFVTYDEDKRLVWFPKDKVAAIEAYASRRLKKIDMKAVWNLDPKNYDRLVTYARRQDLAWNNLEDLCAILGYLDLLKQSPDSSGIR